MHTHGGAGRRRGRSRPRILYWFRTPPGVRIGRAALDEDAIRLIEEHNPDVEFDWTRILKGQDEPASEPERREHQRQRPAPQGPPARPVPPAPSGKPSTATNIARAGEAESRAIASPIPAAAGADEVEPIAVAATPAEEPEAAVVESFLAEPRIEPPIDRPQPGDAISAVEARLGSEGLARLRARYAEVMARISDTIPDPVRKDELKSQAERLNPDTWVTEAEVTAALEAYESVFETLRGVVGRPRRRRRRGSGRVREQAGTQSGPDAASAEPAAGPDAEEPGEDH